MLRKSSGGVEWSSGTEILEPDSGPRALDAKIQSTLRWSTGVYRIDDLQVSPSDQTGAPYLCTYSLAELDQDSGKITKKSSNCTQFAIKAEGKELGLLSGLLGRHCSFGELRYHRLVQQDALVEEIHNLRAENQSLIEENQNLYGALETLQRPKMISG
jgi:cell division protein FtsB